MLAVTLALVVQQRFDQDAGAAPPAAKRNFLSSTLGSHMVLQRAPQQAKLWGFDAAGSIVHTLFDGNTYSSTADRNGTWRQTLPATRGSSRSFNITINSSTSQSVTITDVLFGDVFMCGGQSNMQFAMSVVTNASQEIQRANEYPLIRLFTVGQGNSSSTPYEDLQTVEQPWVVASNRSVSGVGPNINEFFGMGYFSAVCFLFGRRIFKTLQSQQPAEQVVPIGLISNNYGGTQIERWMPPEAFDGCNKTSAGHSNLWNAMVEPYVTGPISLAGFTWYQGESNAPGIDVPGNATAAVAAEYGCLFTQMIGSWRSRFQHRNAFFGFVQLASWCYPNSFPLTIAEMREAQMMALSLPNVGYATNADHGDGCNIHSPPKQYCATRLADSALALHYNHTGLRWKSPSYLSAASSVSIDIESTRETPASASAASAGLRETVSVKVVVVVSLADVGTSGITEVYPANYLQGEAKPWGSINCTVLNGPANRSLSSFPGSCAWAAIQLASGQWVNATATAMATVMATTNTSSAFSATITRTQGPGSMHRDVGVYTGAGTGQVQLHAQVQVPLAEYEDYEAHVHGQQRGAGAGAGGRIATAAATGPTVGIDTHRHRVRIVATPTPKASFTPVASAYGWGAIPLMHLYDEETQLPVLPWNRTL